MTAPITAPTHQKFLFGFIFSLSFVLLATGFAEANLCKHSGNDRSDSEAQKLESEFYSIGDTGFDRDYNSRLIRCNRLRDSNGKKIEENIEADHNFDPNLAPMTVKGHYSYFGLGVFSKLRYAYQLSREGGKWVVTVPIEFHFPKFLWPDKIDIPQELVQNLNLNNPGEVCEPGTTRFNATDPRKVLDGPITYELQPTQLALFQQELLDAGIEGARLVVTRSDIESNGLEEFLHDYDVAFYQRGPSCRVSRSLARNGMTILNHLRQFWIDRITHIWNKTGFEIRPRFIKCEEGAQGSDTVCDSTVTEEELAAWQKDETIWHVRFNSKPYHRPSFKRWVAKWNHMHSGSNTGTITHELGHYLGLDDEYGEDDTKPKHCNVALPGARNNYLMCRAGLVMTERRGRIVLSGTKGTQGVYPWIITRRYPIARDFQCKKDRHCAEDQYCKKGTLTIGRNSCVAKKNIGDKCSRKNQCSSGCCKVFRFKSQCRPAARCD